MGEHQHYMPDSDDPRTVSDVHLSDYNSQTELGQLYSGKMKGGKKVKHEKDTSVPL